MSRRRHGGDEGSSIPLVLLCVLVSILLVVGTVVTSSAFLAQRDLQADCDAAAAAAANGVDVPGYYLGGGVELATGQARAAAEAYRLDAHPDDPTLELSAAVVDDRVRVDCARTVAAPLGPVVGVGATVPRRATGVARLAPG